MKKAFKVFCWVILGFLAFCALIATFSDNDSSASPTEQKQETEQQTSEQQVSKQEEEIEQTEAKQETKQEESIYGTYEITDKVGCTIHLTINEDETATITGVRGEDVIYYCSWHDAEWQGAEIRIDFSDDKPYLVYEGGADEDKYKDLFIKEGWIYSGISNAKSKNPKWRLKLEKIN